MISLFRSNSSIFHVCAGGERGWKFLRRWQWQWQCGMFPDSIRSHSYLLQWRSDWRCGMLPDPLRSFLLLLITLPYLIFLQWWSWSWWWFGRKKLWRANIPFSKRECVSLESIFGVYCCWHDMTWHDMTSIENANQTDRTCWVITARPSQPNYSRRGTVVDGRLHDMAWHGMARERNSWDGCGDHIIYFQAHHS